MAGFSGGRIRFSTALTSVTVWALRGLVLKFRGVSGSGAVMWRGISLRLSGMKDLGKGVYFYQVRERPTSC